MLRRLLMGIIFKNIEKMPAFRRYWQARYARHHRSAYHVVIAVPIDERY